MNQKKHPQIQRIIDLVLFTLLIHFTAFVVLQNFLQGFVGWATRTTATFLNIEISPLKIFVYSGLSFFLYTIFKRQNAQGFLKVFYIAFLYYIGLEVSDYYLDAPFYSPQQNWHFVTYAIFALLALRVFSNSNFSPNTQALICLGLTLLVSTSDETVQHFTSKRVFDIGDISKDLWGCFLGLSVDLLFYKKKYTKKLYFAVFGLTLIFLLVSSLLSDSQYLAQAISITLVVSVIFLIIQALVLKFIKNRSTAIKTATLIFALCLGYFWINHDKPLKHILPGFYTYRALPLAYFDFFIKPNGHIRFTDKKKRFNKTDINTILKTRPMILVVGSGEQGNGGEGFPSGKHVQFIFNPHTQTMVQVIVQPNHVATKTYLHLINKGKSVGLLIHQDI